ncbi:MAG: ergothioneine biosynthesis protein EgtB, partial [Bacteroidota bacterium]
MISTSTRNSELVESFDKVRSQTTFLCEPLEIEDFVVQPVVDVSPLKWHLAHTTWFFEAFILSKFLSNYQVFHADYGMLFNSYYIAAGDRWIRAARGQLTRPTVKEIFEYREYVNEKMHHLLEVAEVEKEIEDLINVGIHHEQQHQELFLYDIKRILGDNPLHPIYRKQKNAPLSVANSSEKWLSVDEGIYEVGSCGKQFHFDNEEGLHKVFLHAFSIRSSLVTNQEYLEFIEDGGYFNHVYWFSEAWDWLQKNKIESPRYWVKEEGEWHSYRLDGFEKIEKNAPVMHVSFYEADAFAKWKGYRLPTEFEWEVACKKYEPSISTKSNFIEQKNWKPVPTGTFDFYGNLWEWTSSPYIAYPFYKAA